jgi:hypothetical protein
MASKTSPPSLVKIRAEVGLSGHKGGRPADLLRPLGLGFSPWTPHALYKSVVARLMVLNNIFTILALKSSKF